METTKKRPVYNRGKDTMELPFLASCAVYLLDRRFWVLGIRFPFRGFRFDVLAKIPSVTENVVLVEAKYRSDRRKVRPYEVKRFAKEVAQAKDGMQGCVVQAFFMTNTGLSKQAVTMARKSRIRFFQKVPMLFDLREGKGEKKKEREEKEADAHKNFSSSQ